MTVVSGGTFQQRVCYQYVY